MQAGTAGDGARMVMGLSSPGAGVLAWSRFAYKAFSTVALDLLKRFLDPLTDITLGGAFTLFWADLYDLREEFSATVTSRMRLACGGIKVMFGVENPWADLLYHQCAAGAELGDGMLRLALDIFVQIPMAKCVCKDVSSRSVSKVVTQKCAPPLPVSLVPTLYAIANELMGTQPIQGMACERVLASVKASIGGALDAYFAHQYLALDALGSSVEYVTAVYDDKAGRCLDFQNDPHVVVIVPQPVDYFQRCGDTSLCKQVCSAEWGAFQAAIASPSLRPPEVLTVGMESLFFPGELDEGLMLGNVSASVELPVGVGGCLLRAGAGAQQDFAIAVAEVSAADVRVQFWCAPRMPSSTVYRSDRAAYGPLKVPGALLDLQFGDDTGAWVAALTQLEGQGGQAVFLLNASGMFQTPPVLSALLGDGNTLLRVENMWLVEGFILIDVLARRLAAFVDPATGRQGAAAETVSVHLALLPPLGTNLTVYGGWRGTDADLLRFGRGDYRYTRLAGGDYLFVPKTQGLLPFRAHLSRVGYRLVQAGELEPLAPASLPSMGDAALAVRAQTAGVVFATSRTGWDWLKQVRLSTDGFVEGVYGSAGVEYRIEIQGSCDERGCEGCGSMQQQRLCLAYSKCALVNCVGTPVHQRRPLCGIGALLRQTGRMGLLSTQGAWAIFTEMLALSLQLGLMDAKEAYLLWPEDQFLCYMCQAKDSSAEFFSILTATINSALQWGHADVGYMYGGASNVDTNADAVLTISSTAINAFMHQMALFPLYGLAVSHQILMCQVSGMIALAPTDDFTLSIRGGKDTPAGDLIAGQCLTVGAEVLASFPKDDPASLGATVTSHVASALERLAIMQIEPILHILDGLLAYLIGVGKAMGTLVQSQNMARCAPPDFFLKDVVHCACGDETLQIPAARRTEGLKEGALWCTGVLGMIDSNNQPYYVHNPYTYAELQGKSAGLQAYVECVGSGTAGYKCVPPNEPLFANQGVTLVNVLVKCRENFVKKRWDPAAYMLFQPTSWDQIEFQADPVLPDNVAYYIQDCLSTGDPSIGSLAQKCLEEFLIDAQLAPETYWQYERLTRSGPEFNDACLVFSGPAGKGLQAFQACVDGMEGTSGCTIPAHLWSPRSDNDVPLATQHRVLSHGVNRDGLVQSLYAQAHDTVMSAIQASLAVWADGDNPEVNASFFSVEGDVLHQAMDCMFMGPYSRVDYWPIPDCPPGEECLRGPFWSRDEGEGQQRQVDPATCAAPSSLPYTCGSPARKSLMRYLVLRLLPQGTGLPNQNTSNVGAILRATLHDLEADWGDVTQYGCDCEDGEVSPQCCATNLSASLLPERLQRAFSHIDSKNVLMALEDDMAALYDLALENRAAWGWYMQDVAPNETQAYDWSGSKRATEEAFFDPTAPTGRYDAQTEAMSPLMQEDSTLWDVCHASLKQVFFTLPLDSAGGVRFSAESAFDGDPARLEEYVRAFTAEAFQHSPLFRHYSPRHAPSMSQMCAEPVNASSDTSEGTVQYTPFTQAGVTLLASGSLPQGRSYHPQRFHVGSEGCLCGWPMRGRRCYPPTEANTLFAVCKSLPRSCSNDGSYDLDGDEDRVLAAFSKDWYCPQIELSPHWGYLDPSANEDWLGLNQTTLTTASRDLFRHGRGGLRPGNMQSLPRLVKGYVNPQTRVHALKQGRLTTCQPPPLVEDLMQPFLDQLFPAAHGADEAGAAAYCLRYAIELARLEILRLLDLPEQEDARALQRGVAERWRTRCGTQLHLLHLCVSLGVFRPLADAASRDVVRCRHFQVGAHPASQTVYATTQCLVSVDGVFYDPCRCQGVSCDGDQFQRLDVNAFTSRGNECRLRFDPRDMLRAGAPIGWIAGAHPLPDPEAALLKEGTAEALLRDPDAVGNVPFAGAWWSAEGPMEGNSELCDTVLDWWPEDWDFPVGYHVTVPCDANDTAYRGFAQAFGLDAETNTLVYQHDLLRDAGLVDSHFGGAGLCRAGSFGMPMPETNNMRYCTQTRAEDTEDFTLPLRYGEDQTDAGNAWGPWKCTASSAQLPWPSTAASSGAHQSTRYSVGTVPNMPPETSATYPATSDDMYDVGPWQEIHAAGGSWGYAQEARCQDYTMLRCPDETACPAGYACRGRVCLLDYSRACTQDSDCGEGGGACRGVCVDPAVACIKHSDCPDEKMCSGLGTCETPVLVVQNRLRVANEGVSMGMAASGGCGSGAREFSLLRASYWGNTGQDLLRTHGMCSFEDWFKYTYAYSKPGCSSPAGDGTFRLDPAKCKLMDLEQLDANQSHWWPKGNLRPEIMFLRPTVCDRDYERLEGFTQCAPLPGTATLRTTVGDVWRSSDGLAYDQFVRLHANETSNDILLAEMPETNETRVGFLGMDGAVRDLQELGGMPYIACGGLGQCFPYRFTVRGAVTRRMVRAGAGWANYSDQDPFICGAFGVRTADGCVLDAERFPLHRLLCTDRLTVCREGLENTAALNAIDRVCTSIPVVYQATDQDRDAVLQGLRDLFYVFPLFNTMAEYLRLTRCMVGLHSAIAARAAQNPGAALSNGLYYPFMFALYEAPFDWFYQCVVMTGFRINPAQRAPQTCAAHATPHLPSDYRSFSASGDSFQTYLQYVRAGYLAEDVERYLGDNLNASGRLLDGVVASLVAQMYPARGTDLSYPRCSKNIVWRVGPYGGAYGDELFSPEKRAVIWNWYDLQTCTLYWHEKLLTRLETLGINRNSWIDSLTDYDAANLERQDGGGGSSVIQQARAYMLGKLGLDTLTVTPGGTGAIRFRNLPPDAYDFAERPLPASLTPTPSASAGTTDMDDSVPRTCVFVPAFDPAFAGLPNFGSDPSCGAPRVDPNSSSTLRFCGDVECSSIPAYYRRNGRFNCRYVADAVIDSTCTEVTPGCEAQVMEQLYAEMWRRVREATTSEAPILAPTVLPWFQAGDAWAFASIDLSGILDYERNIQPDPQRAVMCEITTDEASSTRFTTCNNPHYLRLQAHARRNYKHDGSVVVPPGGQLEWPVDRSVLARGVMLYYANTNRSIRKRFMDALFDDETVCKGDPAQHVCRKEAQNSVKFRTINPWMLGNFNPYEVCDVEFTAPGEGAREYIYTYCLDQGNAACQDYRQRAPPTCGDKHRRLVQQVGVPRFLSGTSEYNEYNLCAHTSEQDSDGCMHDQGLLGGYDGLPVASPKDTSYSMIYGTQYEGVENYTVAGNLYENSAWSIPGDFRSGMYAGRNPLWHGGEAPYGHIQVDENEIGGHRIGMVIKRANESLDVISNMTIERLSLNTRASQSFLDETSASGLPVQEWVQGLQAAMAEEDAAVRRLYELRFPLTDLAASCPLQRWTFYSGGYASFSPTLPAAKRAQHLFHRVHGGKLAHPTMRPGGAGQFLGQYRSANGFCACPVLKDIQQSQCLVSVNSDTACSLRSTIRTLMGDAGTESFVFPTLNNEKATRYCNMQLDWPLVDGTLRDGTALDGRWEDASSPTHKECHVLDRFRPFQYKYVAADTLAPSGKNTVRDGVCSTGRLVTLQADKMGARPPYARCLRTQLFSTSAQFECNTTAQQAFTLPRRSRLTLAEVLARRDLRRMRCAQCSKPPAFRSQQGRPIPPESSFGRLHRASPERLLAKDLRDALCPAGATAPCPALNASGWRKGAFMENYLLHPERLFSRNQPLANKTARAVAPPTEDPSLWAGGKPWVYCPSASALKTGEGCQGTITRADWVARKTTLCPQMVRSYSTRVTNSSGGDPMARTTFCPIDRTTDGVCGAIVKARELVRQANCIARGNESCMPHPFVYHAASYEPSNNAWVHDSVKSFYSRVDLRACPHNTSTDTQLIEFARAYQRTCPANGVNLFVGVLKAVRTVVVDAVLLLATLIGMAFRTLQLFLVSGRDATRQQIGTNWAYIRSKARATLDTVGDLLVDTMLNSGEVGARVMVFLRKSCDGLNAAVEWFLYGWCNYIQKYMLQFLAGFRKLLGITGAGFDILQDFMDEIFQGILPAAFVAKYATGIDFQSMLTEAYSEPTKKKVTLDSAGNVINNVPDTANPQQVSRSAEKRGVLARTFGPAGRFVKGIAKASLFAGIGLGLVDLVQGIMSSVAEERLRSLYPSNFTLFDLSDIVNVVDEMEDFVLSPQSQQTCASFQLMKKAQSDWKMFQCLDLSLDKYAGTTAGATSIDPTMCWANAAPSLGQNSMFSCTAASTCRRSTDSTTESILCASCPEPALAGVNRYGCDSLLLQCACSQAKTSHSSCAANRQCEAQSECELVSAISSVSYGTIPCGNCPNTARLMCLLPPTGMPARCSCMLAGAPSYDLCSDRSGYRTPVDSTRLCGYLHNRAPDLARWVFDMDDLIILRCAQVSTGICSDVHRTGSVEPLRMVVAETLRASSGSRRLLAEDQVAPDPSPPVYDAYESEYELENTEALHELLTAPGWNTTAAPCSALALAYQAGQPKLGLLETHVLHTCGFWRYVGRRVIERYNLTEVLEGHETFLLSMDDLVYAAMAPDAGLALLLNPGIFVSAFMHHPWMKPVRAVGVMIANQLEYLHWIRSIDADVHEALFGDLPAGEHAKQAKEQALQRVQQRISPRNVPRTSRKPGRPLQDTAPELKPKRRLLTTEDILAYSARVIQSPDATGQLPSRVYGAWSTSAFVWPPRYDYSLKACPIAVSTLDLGTQVILVNKMYFENFDMPQTSIDRSLRASLPNLGWMSSIPPSAQARNQTSWASVAFHWLLDLVAVRPEQLVSFFTTEEKWSLTWILTSLTHCDLASTLTCSRHDKDLLMSTVAFALMYLVIAAVTDAIGVGFLATLFLLSYPSFILWYAFGMAPSCIPLLPTCLLADVITTAEALVPKKIVFPDILVCGDNKTACLRPCSDIGFTHGLDPLAFALCDTDDSLCTFFRDVPASGFQLLDDAVLTPLREGATKFRLITQATGPVGIDGYRLCTWVSFVTVVPYMAAIGALTLVTGVLIVAAMDMLPPLVALVCQTYVFYES